MKIFSGYEFAGSVELSTWANLDDCLAVKADIYFNKAEKKAYQIDRKNGLVRVASDGDAYGLWDKWE